MSGDLPAGWTWASFATVARIAANLVDPASLSHLPHIAPDNIERDTGRLLPHRSVGDDGVRSAKHQFYPGQLLYSKIRPYLNKCVRVDFEGLCSADMYPLDPLIEPSFLHQYILTRQFVSEVTEAAGSRTVLPKTNQKQLANVPVPVAPQAEQHRVVSAIESYLTRIDDAVATLERVQRYLKRYRASVLKAAVEGRLVPTEAELARAEGRSYEPAPELLKRILAERRRRWEEAELAKMTAKGKAPKDDKWKAKYVEPAPPDTSELPQLPHGWCWATIDQLFDARLGKMLDREKNTGELRPYLRNANVRWFAFDLTDVKEMRITDAELDQVSIRFGDLVVCEGGEPGRAAVWTMPNESFVIQKACHRLRPHSGIDSHFFAFVLATEAASGALSQALTGSTIKHLTGVNLYPLPVPLPPATEQVRIVGEVARILSVADSLEHQTATSVEQRLTQLRQSILKWAFEGRLVDQVPTDEPASVLLERIRAERASATDTAPRRARKAKAKKS